MFEKRNASIYLIFSQSIELLFWFENKCYLESSVLIFINGIKKIRDKNCCNTLIKKIVNTGHGSQNEKPDTPMS